MLRQLGREDWVQAGIAALALGGAVAFRVEAVARELCVTKGSFYWHFRDKAAWRDAVLGYWEHRMFLDLVRPLPRRSDGVDWAAVERALRVWGGQDVAVARAVARVLRERALVGAVGFASGGLRRADPRLVVPPSGDSGRKGLWTRPCRPSQRPSADDPIRHI